MRREQLILSFIWTILVNTIIMLNLKASSPNSLSFTSKHSPILILRSKFMIRISPDFKLCKKILFRSIKKLIFHILYRLPLMRLNIHEIISVSKSQEKVQELFYLTLQWLKYNFHSTICKLGLC
jgi:hypothetical protein